MSKIKIEWIALAFVILLPAVGKAAEKPAHSNELKALTTSLVSLTVLDVESTQRWEAADRHFRELAPWYPRRPSRSRMYVESSAAIGSTYLVARHWYRNGHKWRARTLLIGYIAAEVWCGQRNLRQPGKNR